MSAPTPRSEPAPAPAPEIRQGEVPAVVHGRHFVVDGGPGAPLLLGCHGYGETAHDHLSELLRIPGVERYTVCAVEALHPFYKKTGDVVRSWMTKEAREQTIADNLAYVASTIATVRRQYSTSDLLVVAGFSQGVAMAWRAAVRSGWPCRGLMVLAGDVPADAVDPPPLQLPAVLLGRGTRDGWYSEQKMEADLEVLDQLGAPVETCVFDDGHVWTDAYRAACAAFLEARLDESR